MDEGYHYPRTVFTDLLTLKQQIEKVESEIFEVHQLLGRKTINYDRVAEEIEDAIQALETARRIMVEKHQVRMYFARIKVKTKLKRKGHYTL